MITPKQNTNTFTSVQADSLVEALHQVGLAVHDELVQDSEIHRFPTEGDEHRETAGWYRWTPKVAFFGDHREGTNYLWKPLNGTFDPDTVQRAYRRATG